jgi:hypothetical protein
MGSKYLALIQENLKAKKNIIDAEVFGTKYTFTPSSTKDEYIIAEYSTKAQDKQDTSEVFSALQNIRARTVASMLYAIDGEVIPDIIKGEDGTEYEKVVYLMEDIVTWPRSILDVLYTLATDLKRRFRETVRDSVTYEWFGEDLLAKEKEEEEELKAMETLEKERRKKVLEKVQETPEHAEEGSFTTPKES